MAKRTNKSSERSKVSPSLAPFGAETELMWSPIVINGVKTPYLVSNYGDVKTQKLSSRYKPGSLLKKHLDSKGYEMVVLSYNNVRIHQKVHRLVASAFVPNIYNLGEINHKDENKRNNRADNLEWCNRLYNVRYGTGIERVNKKRRKTKICQFDKTGKLVKLWDSIKDAGRALGIDSANITKCALGKNKTYKEYIWLSESNPRLHEELDARLKWLNERPHNIQYGKMVKVGACDKNGHIINIFDGIREAERQGFQSSGIIRSIKTHRIHRGYYWIYI